MPGKYRIGDEKVEMDFKERAICGMLLVLAVYAFHTLLWAQSTIVLPFIISFMLVQLLEGSVETAHRFLTCRMDLREKVRSYGRVLRSSPPPAETAATDSGTSTGEGDGDDEEETPLLGWRGKYPSVAVYWDGFCRAIAVCFALFLLAAVVAGLSLAVFHAALQVKTDWPVFQDGTKHLIDTFNGFIGWVMQSFRVTDERTKKALEEPFSKILTIFEDFALDTVNSIVSGISTMFEFSIMTFLYVLFWLLEPLQLSGRSQSIVRHYLKRKFIVSLGYSVTVFVLLGILKVSMAELFAIASFIMSFLPEIGPIISTLLPTPAILLDSRLPNPFGTLFLAITGQVMLKIFFSLVVEQHLMDPGQEMRIHPVWIVCSLMYFSYLFGVLGMLVSVPALVMFKAVVSTRGFLPSVISTPIVNFLEGSNEAKQKREMARRASQSSADAARGPGRQSV